MNQLQLTIAQASFCLQSTEAGTPLTLHPDYYPFMKPDLAASCVGGTYSIAPSTPDDWAGLAVTESLWDSDIWRLGYLDDGSLLLEVRDLPRQTYLKVAQLAPDFSTGTIVARSRSPQPPYALNHPEEQLILLNRLSHLQAGLVHSSCVVVDGKGYLFYGRSGAGKTTIGRLWKDAGFKLICDDRNLVRIIDGTPHACGTPWHGEDPEVHAENAPLGGVFNLIQDPENRLEEIGYAEAVARLHSNTLAPFYLSDGTARVIDTYTQALESVPSYNIYFTPDQRPIDMCLAEVMRCSVS